MRPKRRSGALAVLLWPLRTAGRVLWIVLVALMLGPIAALGGPPRIRDRKQNNPIVQVDRR